MTETATLDNEAQLMRTCGHLYVSIAMESFSTTLLAIAFSYLLLLITNKGRLKNPGKALYAFVRKNWDNFYSDLREEVSHWREMPALPLERRFALCRKVNQAVCMLQILIAVLTVERWLHINNVNGFRYLGYSITCPPMQAQLIVLIAPVVPCYKFNVMVTYVMTMLMLWFGYAASVIPGDLWTGEFSVYLDTWNLDDLKPNYKFWFTCASALAQVYLTFVQIPWLLVLFHYHGGTKVGLPRGYTKLLIVVAITWLAFPIWWALSFEGLSIITDTKMNAAGFALLNVGSKGCFTLHMLQMVKWHRHEKQRQECLETGLKPVKVGLFDPSESANLPAAQKDFQKTETWVVSMLRHYDDEEEAVPHEWAALEPIYRAYLVGRNVTPETWKQMGTDQRQAMHNMYESKFDLVHSEAGTPVAAAPAVTASAPTEKGQDMEEWPAFRMGQTLTTVHGHRGRVQKVLPQHLLLTVPGGKMQTVSKDDVTVLKVTYLGVRGLREADESSKMDVYCGCMVESRPSSEALTPPTATAGSRATWVHEMDVLGFVPGDGIAFRLYGSDPLTGKESQLGEALLPGDDLEDAGFEGELQLFMADGQGVKAQLAVTVVVVNHPSIEGSRPSIAARQEFCI